MLRWISRTLPLLFLCVLLRVQVFAQSAPGFDVARIERATVMVTQTHTVEGVSQITCVSSGTLVSADGLILTNAHGTVPNVNCNGDTLIISLSVREGEPPIPAFRATVIQADAGLDLALLRINAEVNGQPVPPSNLSLPFVALADSDAVRLDETVYITGYPGIGDDPVTTVPATIQGFTAEPRGEDRAWLKFRVVSSGEGTTEIGGTVSGGGAYTRDGFLVGIPTTAPFSRTSDAANCVQLQDTNRDGLIGAADACVPLGGSINTLRPSNFAQPLLQSAQLGLTVSRPEPAQTFSGLPAQTFSGLFFAPSVNNGMPTTVIENVPSGTSSLYLFFDYDNLTPETVYELRVSVNGTTSPVFSLPPVRWSGGQRGLWYIGLIGQPLPNGELSFSLFVNGQLASEPKLIRVGGSAESRPAFRSIAFLLSGEGQQMFGNGYILGIGNTVTAQFTYDNMSDGSEWIGIWYHNGQERRRFTDSWDRGSNGSSTTSITVDSGLVPGRYRLALYIEGRLSALADFTVAGQREDIRPRVFSSERFTLADTPQQAASERGIGSVTNPIQSLFAVFDWEALAPGTLWQMRWSVDDRVFYDAITPWTLDENGTGYVTRVSTPSALPDGRYRMELLMNGILLRSIDIDVGIGQLPLDIFRESEGVLLRGRVIDGDTRRGVPDVTILVLSEEFSVEDFTARADQVYTQATTDRDGRYQFSDLLFFGVPYSIIITADGYLPITADAIEVSEETANPLVIDIYLTPG